MYTKPIQTIAILGGGTAGWSAAALLARHYAGQDVTIVLVEAEDIPTVGVGEATVPAIVNFHRRLNIDEAAFIKATGATFKLGIALRDWGQVGEQFFHPFSDFGLALDGVDFHQCWLALRRRGFPLPIQAYSLCATLAAAGKFALPDIGSQNPLAWYGYAYHFDAHKYATFLRHYAEKLGVRRVLGTVVGTETHLQSACVLSLLLAGGKRVRADFFIDCSGFNARLLHGVYGVAYEDWQRYLPCNKAWAVQTRSTGDALPAYTLAQGLSAGWRWKIPLQQRYGNGYVFADNYIDTQKAKQEFLSTLREPLIGEPRLLSFRSGMRRKFWLNNVAAVGLAAGFIEPLESTSISLAHTGIEKIIAHLPQRRLLPEAIAAANRLNRLEFERVRDFIILHYWASKRGDSDFWRSFNTLALPDLLAEKIARYLRDGQLQLHDCESFRAPSWMAMYSGFNMLPRGRPQDLALPDEDCIEIFCSKLRHAVLAAKDHACSHRDFLATVG